MDLKHTADAMFSCWVLGLIMIYLVKNSKYSYLLRIEPAALFRFAKFLLFLTSCRLFYYGLIAPQETLDSIKAATNMMAWPTFFGVYWEDACNAMALVVMTKLFKQNKLFNLIRLPILTMMSISFGMGHAYQGMQAAVIMSLYIPITMTLGRRYGFGTVMLCHIAYDLLTFFSLKTIAGV